MRTMDSIGPVSAEAEGGFTVTRKIRFGDTDPAGIVYYPNYFNMFNEVVEDWFEEDLGISFRELHQVRNLGIPMAHVECDFIAPCKLGELVTFKLVPTQLGRTSMQMQITLSQEDQVRVSATMVVVFVDLVNYRSVEPPAELRALISSRVVAAP